MQNVEQETLVEKNVAPLFLQIYPNFNKIKIIKKSGHFEKKMDENVGDHFKFCFELFLLFLLLQKKGEIKTLETWEKCV